MNIIITSVVFFLIQVALYFWLRNDIKCINFYHKRKCPFYDHEDILEKINRKESIDKSNLENRIITSDVESNSSFILSKSLKHLEYISEFEMYLERKNYKSLPLDFLQEFESLKTEAKISLLKTASQLNNNLEKAA